jgi:glyoxylase-like metal-dependent hydrolase (beta-lactamase superfamily II)
MAEYLGMDWGLIGIERIVVGPIRTNSYIVYDADDRIGIVIDPGGDAELILDAIRALGVRISAIYATHAHFDHVLSVDRLREELSCKFALHRGDEWLLRRMPDSARRHLGYEVDAIADPDEYVEEGQRIGVGGFELRVLHTPGHTPGSISLVGEGVAFTGDTLFAGSVGRTDFEGGDPDALVGSLLKLLSLPDHYEIRPGHGRGSSIGIERVRNPFLRGLVP